MMSETHAGDQNGRVPIETVRTLLLDDCSFDRARIRRLAGKTSFDVQLDEVQSITEMTEAISDEAYDLVLIDYRLPVGDGLTALKRLQQAPRNQSAGRIMVTGNGALDTAVSAMRSGCHDFLSKDTMTAHDLETAMQNALIATRSNSSTVAQQDQRAAIQIALQEALGQLDLQQGVSELVREAVRAHSTPLSCDLDAVLTAMLHDDEFIFH